MPFDLYAALPQLTTKAIAWAEAQSSLATKSGESLNAMLTSVAESVGVLHPARIRLVEVSRLSMPDDLELQQAALVFRPGNSLTKSREFLEDGVSGSSPHEGA